MGVKIEKISEVDVAHIGRERKKLGYREVNY